MSHPVDRWLVDHPIEALVEDCVGPCGDASLNLHAALAEQLKQNVDSWATEAFALEVVDLYLLDVEGTVRWLGTTGHAAGPQPS